MEEFRTPLRTNTSSSVYCYLTYSDESHHFILDIPNLSSNEYICCSTSSGLIKLGNKTFLDLDVNAICTPLTNTHRYIPCRSDRNRQQEQKQCLDVHGLICLNIPQLESQRLALIMFKHRA
jgi:hypothetical protein